MKIVVSLVVALTLAVYSVALAANDSTKTSDNAKTSGNTNTSGTVNNTNTPNDTNTSGSNTTTNNKNTSATNNTSTDKTWNNANTSTTNKKWNKKWNKNNTSNKNKTSNSTNVSNDTTTWDSSNKSTQELLKVSSDGFAAIRAIRAARVAIFNGQPMVATKMLVKAKVDLTAASKKAPTFVAEAEATVNGKVVADAVEVGKMNWIPIDGQVSLADTFVVTTEKAQHIKKANEHFKNGKSKEAIEELRLAAINVTCTRVLMPLTATTDWVAEATKLLSQQKYYEANLVLKAAEDGLVVNTANLVEMPQVKTEKAPRQTN